MDEREFLLYQAMVSYAMENIFWQLVFLNNALFDTPLGTDAKSKLEAMSKRYATIITNIYPAADCQGLIDAMTNSNALFASYIEHLLANSEQTACIKKEWLDNAQCTTQALCEINPYWKSTEWNAMLRHQNDLLESIVTNMLDKNYIAFANMAPICQRLAMDMSDYMCSGIVQQMKNSWT